MQIQYSAGSNSRRAKGHYMSDAFDHRRGSVLDVGGAQVYYELAGQHAGPALLMLHGGLGHIEDLNGILPAVAAEYRVIGIDSRGHGRSTLGREPLTYGLLQRDVEKVLAHLGIRTASVIGFNDGGVLGYRLAARSDTERVKVARLVAIGARWRLTEKDPVVRLLEGVTAAWWKDKFPEGHASYRRLNPEPDFDRLAAKVARMWLDVSPAGYPARTVQAITCPTLVVRGRQDHLFSFPEAVELVGLVKDSRLLNILSAGHAAFDDRKELFKASLIEFLREESVVSGSRVEVTG